MIPKSIQQMFRHLSVKICLLRLFVCFGLHKQTCFLNAFKKQEKKLTKVNVKFGTTSKRVFFLIFSKLFKLCKEILTFDQLAFMLLG